MKLQLNFCNIVDQPLCCIQVNKEILFSGSVQNQHTFDINVNNNVNLVISHYGKIPSDTVVENNTIIRDRSFELSQIIVDGYDLEELKWLSEFRSTNGEVYPSCLFFGPNGDFIINFEVPILRWMLQQRHIKNNNDPDWEQDYNYYVNACNLLTQISKKLDS